ncbi:MAG: hypothetical protein K9H49_09100 [Bacteroidales bacterium]|nr:hypothetical protein [Bacteroidales bacterium]MCF8392077.1 hypothetical protein [Bacteroidales bacterium]
MSRYNKVFQRLFILINSLIIFPVISLAQSTDSILINIQHYEYQKALELVEKSDNYQSDILLVNYKAIALKGLNKFQEAIPLYLEIYKNDTLDVKSINDLANCYRSIGDFSNTKKFLYKALSISPQNNYLYQQLADVYFMEDDYKNAIPVYKHAYYTDSGYYLSKQLAKCYEFMERKDSAIFYYHKAVAKNPVDFQSTYSLADLYKQKEEYDTAITISQAYLNIDSTHIKMLKLNAYLYFLNKDFYTSRDVFEKCIQWHDSSDFTIKYLGYSYFKVEEYESAKDYLEQAYLKDTLNVELCYILGLACDYSIYKKLAIHYLNKVIELSTPKPEFLSDVYQDLAVANAGYYKHNDALDAYLKALELTPDDTLLLYKIGSHCDHRLKNKNMALVYYRKFMKTRPSESVRLPMLPSSGGMSVSYYDFVEKRMREIEEELFWEGEAIDTSSKR